MPRKQNQNNIVIIKTESGCELGYGHLQRMAALLFYLRHYFKKEALMLTASPPPGLPRYFLPYIRNTIDCIPCCIVRDMRDSSVKEIAALRKYAPVIVIDDMGNGRSKADFAVDFLPCPPGRDLQYNSGRGFIYGYNFISGLKNCCVCTEVIDFVLYPGAGGAEYVKFIFSSLPPGSSLGVLDAAGIYVLRNSRKTPWKYGYVNLLLSCGTVITHFGLLIYEARLCGSNVITVNPGKYHAALADTISSAMKITNAGVFSRNNRDYYAEIFRESLQKKRKNPDAAAVLKRAESNVKTACKNILQLAQQAVK